MYKIFVVEDDTVIAGEICRHLGKWGYEVEAAEDFTEITGQFARCRPQLVLMDIGLPFYNGYHWCAEIRKLSKVPIIFISSAGERMDIVMAVNMGGDDFITKPFELDVLAAKVQAMLRRAYAFQEQTELLEHGGVILDLTEMALFHQGKKLGLTRNEYKILQMLFEKAGRAAGREALMERLWDSGCYVDDNTLTVNMNRLRRKLEEEGIPVQIITKKGVGYCLGGG